MAQRLFVPTEEQRLIVKLMAGMGIPHDEIRRAIKKPGHRHPIGKKALERKFGEELRTGRAYVKSIVATSLIKHVRDDQNAAATIFASKTILGLREVERREIGGIPDGVPISVETMNDEQLDSLIRRLQSEVARETDSGKKTPPSEG